MYFCVQLFVFDQKLCCVLTVMTFQNQIQDLHSLYLYAGEQLIYQ